MVVLTSEEGRNSAVKQRTIRYYRLANAKWTEQGSNTGSTGNCNNVTKNAEQDIPISMSSKVLDRVLKPKVSVLKPLLSCDCIHYGSSNWLVSPGSRLLAQVHACMLVPYRGSVFPPDNVRLVEVPLNLNTPFWQHCSSLRRRFKRGRQPRN